MAVYTVRTRDVWVIGRTWVGYLASEQYKLPKDIEPTRAAILAWLDTHSGDFQSLIDFSGSIEEVEIPWAQHESLDIYMNTID